MGELGDGTGTNYPGGLDTNNTAEVNSPNAGKTKARAEVPNDHSAAIVGVQKELGTNPAGSLATVKAFLQLEHNTDGTHITDDGTLKFAKGERFIDFFNVIPGVVNSPDTDILGNKNVFLLDPDTDEGVQFEMTVPDDCDTTQPMLLKFQYAPSSTNAGDAIISMTYRITAAGEDAGSGGQSTTVSATITMSGTTNREASYDGSAIIIIAASIGAVRESIGAILFRDANNGSDTFTGDFKIWGVKMEYTKNKI